MPRRSRDRLGRLALLTPSCGGQSADREEKRVTYGNGWRHEEQLDPNNANQRRHLEALLSRMFCRKPISAWGVAQQHQSLGRECGPFSSA